MTGYAALEFHIITAVIHKICYCCMSLGRNCIKNVTQYGFDPNEVFDIYAWKVFLKFFQRAAFCGKVKVKWAYSSLQAGLPTPLRELTYHNGITQCYLPPGRGDMPAFTPAEAGTRFSDPGGMQGWVDLGRLCCSWDKCLIKCLTTFHSTHQAC